MPGRTERIAVCIIVENNAVPFDRRVWKEARALTEAGYRVSVICPKRPGCASSHEILEGIEIYRHRKWEATGAIGYVGEYSWSLICEFLLALKVYGRTRFRVLQACNPPDTIFLIGAFFKLFGVRFVFDHHDLSPELFEAKFGRKGLVYRLLRAAERLTFRTADVCVATNESYREIALGRGGKRPEQVFVVRNCPDLADIPAALPRSATDRETSLRVVYVGLMAEQDGIHLLLEAVEHMVKRENRQDVEFVLVGDGPALPSLQSRVAASGLAPYVTFTGRVPYDEVTDHLSRAHIGVAADPKNALNDQSTMIKIMEYMAHGMPTVLFDLKEGRRIADQAALYASPNNPIDFAAQITKLLDCEKLRRQLGDCGRERVERRLNWQSEKVSLLAAYEAALEKRGGARAHAAYSQHGVPQRLEKGDLG